MQCYDVVISGAGPAGCSAALFLARNGIRVALLDKAKFPRDKVCGDAVMAGSSRVLHALGVLDLIRERLGSMTPFLGVTLVAPSGVQLNGRFSRTGRPEDESCVIPRRVLDECLVSAVRAQTSIAYFEQTTVGQLVMQGDRAAGVVSSAGEFYGRFIIGADGAYSPVAKSLGLLNRDKNHQGFAIRAYFSKVDGLTDSIELHYEHAILPGYGWVFPVDTERANIGVGIMNRFTDQRIVKRMFGKFLENNPSVAARLKHAVMETGTLRAWPLPFGSLDVNRGRGNVLLAGDAGSFVDPVTGEGIYSALKSGQYAAEAIATAMRGHGDTDVLTRYEQLWKNEFQKRVFRPGYAIQPLFANERYLDAFLRYVGKKQHRADLIADVIGQNRRRRELFRLLNPFL